MMNKNKLNESRYDLPRWKKITASVMIPVLTMTFTAPTLASIRINQTIEQLEDHLASSSRYLLDAQVDNHIKQYNQNLGQLDIRDGLTDLMTTVFNDYPQFEPEIDWAPISGDITFFVPLPTPKAYGDGAMQREIVRFQLNQLIGSSRLSALGFSNYEQMQTEYYQNAISFMQDTGHRLGDTLSQQDIEQLQYDIIWPEKRFLPGVGRVFIPFVYLTSRTIDAQSRCLKNDVQTPRLSEIDKASLQHAIAKGMSDLVHESRESSSHYYERFSSPLTELTDGLAHFYEQSREDANIRFENYDCQTGEPERPDYIGSAYIQRDLIVQQLNVLLNRSYLVAPKSYDTYQDMAQELYQNGFQYLQSNGLIFGQKLTQAQMDNLPKDMLWPEFEILANGSKVLVPRIYLTAQTVEANKVDGTTFSVGEGTITATDFLNKGGKVLAMRDTLIRTRNSFINDKGYLSAKEGIKLQVGGLLSNLSGTIEGRDVKLTAYALKNQTLVYRYDHAYGFNEQAQQLAKIESFGDLNIQTASQFLSIGGQFSSQGDLKVNAGGAVHLLPAEVRHQDAQSGHGWSQSSQSLTNIQTKMSAIDLLSIATKQTIVSRGSILESEGTLELLAGQGIHLLAALDFESWQKMFEASSGGVFGSSEKREESEQRSQVVSTLLRAGYDLVLATEAGPVQLRATHLTSHGLTRVTGDTIDLELELEKYFYSFAESSEDAIVISQKGHGISKETAHMSQFRAQGGLVLDARNGITVELPRNPNQAQLDHHALIDQLATNDGLRWIRDIRDNHPDAKWEEIDLVLEQWDYEQTGLTPAAMAILVVVVAIATGGAGAGAAASAGGAGAAAGTGAAAAAGTTVAASAGMSAAASAALTAGTNALIVQASASLLANGGDISDTFDQLTTSESVTSLATSMITAGVMQGLDLNFVSDGLNSAGVNEMVVDIAQQSVNSIFSSVVAIQVNSVLSGEGLSGIDDFDDMVVNAVVTSAIATVGKKLANKIGEARRGADPISTASGYIAHAALGCAMGAATQIAAGGNSDSNVSGCTSGSAGAVIGEFAAELYRDSDGVKERTKELEEKSKELTDKILSAIETGSTDRPSQASLDELTSDLLELHRLGGDVGRLVAGITLFVAGGDGDDVSNGMLTAGNAAENNAFFLIPFLIKAVVVVNSLLTAYEVGQTLKKFYKIYKGSEKLDPYDLLFDLAIDIGLDVAGKKIPFAKLADMVTDKLKRVHPDLAHHIEDLKLSFVENPQTGKVESTGKRVHEPIEVNGNNIVKPRSMSDTEWDSYREYQKNTPNSNMHPDRYKELCEQQNYHPTCNNFVIRDKIIPQKGMVIGDPETIYIDHSILKSKSWEFEPYKNIDNGQISDRTSSMTISELLEESKKAKALSQQADPNVLNGANPVNQAAKATFYTSQVGEAVAAKVAADKGWGRPLATVAAGQKNGGNYQFDQVYVDNGIVTIVEAKAGVSVTPSKSSHKIGDERFEQGHHNHTQSTIRHMQERYRNTRDPNLQITLDAMKDAIDNGQLRFKVVHQRIDSNGSLGKLSVTEYDQSEVVFPQSRSF